MNPAQRARMLQAIIDDLKSGNFHLSLHAAERLTERNVKKREISRLFRGVHTAELQADQTVKVRGYDEEGEKLTVIAAYIGKTLILTVY